MQSSFPRVLFFRINHPKWIKTWDWELLMIDVYNDLQYLMTRANRADSILSPLMGAYYSGELKLKGIATLSNMKACHQAK